MVDPEPEELLKVVVDGGMVSCKCNVENDKAISSSLSVFKPESIWNDV